MGQKICGTTQFSPQVFYDWSKKILHLIAMATSEISKGRQVISPEDLNRWQQDTWTYLSSKPELLEALQDPNRLWNQDETSVELGCEIR